MSFSPKSVPKFPIKVYKDANKPSTKRWYRLMLMMDTCQIPLPKYTLQYTSLNSPKEI